MAMIRLDYSSRILGRSTDIMCYIPDDINMRNELRGVITLLHGVHGCAGDWFNYTACQRYAAELGLALVSPSCGNSFYTDMAYGENYFTFLTEELPKIRADILSLPADRAKNFIFGLSMGGYGAFMLALNRPQDYCACASFSGALGISGISDNKDNEMFRRMFAPAFGDSLNIPPRYSLEKLVEQAEKLPRDARPEMLAVCGAEDTEKYLILQQNRYFNAFMRDKDMNFEYLEWHGKHEWSFWEQGFVLALDKFVCGGYLDKISGQWRFSPQKPML